jgi:transposase
LVDGRGTPLALRLTGANRHDSTQAMKLIDAIPPIRPSRRGGRRRLRPDDAYADRAYGTPINHRGLKQRRIKDHFAHPGMPHGSGLGRVRQVVERTLQWIGHARRLKIRYEKTAAPHRALHYLQMARMCCRILQRDF